MTNYLRSARQVSRMLALADGLLGLVSEVRASERPLLSTLAGGMIGNAAIPRFGRRSPRRALSAITSVLLLTAAVSAVARSQAFRLAAHRVQSWSQATTS